MVNLVMVGLSGVISMVGFGSVAIILLVVAWLKARLDARADSPQGKMNRSLARITLVALLLHLAVLVVLVVEIAIAVEQGEGYWQAFLTHYLIDHVAEFVIGFGLMYAAVTQYLRLDDELYQLRLIDRE